MGAKNNQRLDQILVDQGLASSKTKAQAMIMAAEVSVEGSVSTKPGVVISTDSTIEIASRSRYVSRGGDKLESVASQLGLGFDGKTVIDVGASTGGFTDFALQHGATRVLTVDVGTGQLDWRLRNDPRVEVHEQTDIRKFETDDQFDIALVDVSFVSVLKIIESVASHIKPGGQIVVMIKPQFEADKAVADKFRGVISDEAVRQDIIDRVIAQLKLNYQLVSEADSKVHGPKGNLEHFVVLKR